MRIEPTLDADAIRSVLNHRRVWPHLFDQPLPEDWAPAPDAVGVFLLISDDEGPIAVAMLIPENSATAVLHHGVLPRAWGPKAREAAHLVFDWAFARWDKLIGWTPANNRPALKLALSLGWTPEGHCSASYFQRGKLVDRVLLGLTRSQWRLLRHPRRQEIEKAAQSYQLGSALMAAMAAAPTPDRWNAMLERLEAQGFDTSRFRGCFWQRDSLIAQVRAETVWERHRLTDLMNQVARG